MQYILETERLFLRRLTQNDYNDLAEILQDEIAMMAYEHAFSDDEVQAWLDNQLRCYREENGLGLWAVIRKSDGEFLGQCGLTYQNTGGEKKEVEVGYLFKRKYWHNGYATEAAKGCMKYAFEKLRLDTVVSIIRDTNVPSMRVAERNGMEPCGQIVKHYYNTDMPHIIYRMNCDEWLQQSTDILLKNCDKIYFENRGNGYMTEEERIFSGRLFASEVPELVEKKLKAHRLSQEFNNLFEEDRDARQSILRELLEDIGDGTFMLGPIRFHYGCHTAIGKNCFMNFNFTVQDDAKVRIGDHCNFGPNVTIVTPLHPMLPDERRGIICEDGVQRFLCYAKPVTIGCDCWFGANVVICPGVTIGDNCVIGAGSVVTKSIPANTFAAGVPACVIRSITEKDTICNLFDELR